MLGLVLVFLAIPRLAAFRKDVFQLPDRRLEFPGLQSRPYIQAGSASQLTRKLRRLRDRQSFVRRSPEGVWIVSSDHGRGAPEARQPRLPELQRSLVRFHAQTEAGTAPPVIISAPSKVAQFADRGVHPPQPGSRAGLFPPPTVDDVVGSPSVEFEPARPWRIWTTTTAAPPLRPISTTLRGSLRPPSWLLPPARRLRPPERRWGWPPRSGWQHAPPAAVQPMQDEPRLIEPPSSEAAGARRRPVEPGPPSATPPPDFGTIFVGPPSAIAANRARKRAESKRKIVEAKARPREHRLKAVQAGQSRFGRDPRHRLFWPVVSEPGFYFGASRSQRGLYSLDAAFPSPPADPKRRRPAAPFSLRSIARVMPARRPNFVLNF